MKTSSAKRTIATKSTGHKVLGPPETSLFPPTPPGVPVPTPVPITTDSTKAQATTGTTKISSAEVLTEGAFMPSDSPGNAPSQVNGGDVVSHAICGVASFHYCSGGSGKTLVDGKGVARTGDTVD